MIVNLITERLATYLKTFLILVVAHWHVNFGPVAHKSCTGGRKLQCSLNTKNIGKHKMRSVVAHSSGR